MIRFRHADDEKRYLALRNEMYRRVTHLPAGLGGDVLRNLAKIEQMLWLEGVRQGLAIAALSEASSTDEPEASGPRSLKAFQAHATVYGSTDSPLMNVERQWAEKYNAEPNDPWLDPKPMRFAPTTLQEAGATEDVPPPLGMKDEPGVKFLPGLPADVTPLDHELPDEPLSPSVLDRIRDVILLMPERPAAYEDLILALHREMKMDAAYLDLQLSSEQGRAVLDQCGLIDMRVPAEVSVRMQEALRAIDDADLGLELVP